MGSWNTESEMRNKKVRTSGKKRVKKTSNSDPAIKPDYYKGHKFVQKTCLNCKMSKSDWRKLGRHRCYN